MKNSIAGREAVVCGGSLHGPFVVKFVLVVSRFGLNQLFRIGALLWGRGLGALRVVPDPVCTERRYVEGCAWVHFCCKMSILINVGYVRILKAPRINAVAF